MYEINNYLLLVNEYNMIILNYYLLLILVTRGYMTVHGEPDVSRSARYILKDFVNVSRY